MMYITICVIVLIGLSSAAEVRELPNFLKTCKMNDPNMPQCMIEKAKLSLPGLLKGSKEFKVPSFLPLKLKEVTVDAGKVVIKLTDFDMYGLDSAELRTVEMDFEKRINKGAIHIDQLRINGTYDLNGKILVLAIQGHGPGYLQFDNLLISVVFTYDLIENPDTPGYHYMKFKNLNIDYTVEKASFKFDNLFNGDKKLGDEMNAFLNENWVELNKDIRPAIISVIESVILKITKSILELVPMEKMFPK